MSEADSRDGKAAPSRAMGQFSALEEGIGTTIVGGQPPGRERSRVNVSAGVEKILYLAASDQRFHEALRQDRNAAIDSSGIPLTASERALLAAAPAAQLEATISALDITEVNLGRRRFMRAVAVSAATLAAAGAAGCGDDRPIPADTRWPSVDAGSLIRDIPVPDTPSVADGIRPDSAGIRPDIAADAPWPSVDAGSRDSPVPDVAADTRGPSADAGVGGDMPQND